MKLLVLIITLTWNTIALGEPSKAYVWESINRAADKVGISPTLLSAVCWKESLHKPGAYNHHDADEGNSAFGICQVLYRTAVSYGLKDSRCVSDFTGKRKKYDTCKLFGPYTSAYYGALYLKYQLDRYGGNLIQTIGAYNSGTFMICRNGTFKSGGKFKPCTIGLPINWKYILSILKIMGELP